MTKIDRDEQAQGVVQVYKDMYPPVMGGIERVVHFLANGLPAQGYRVKVLVSSRSRRPEVETQGKAVVVKAGQLGRLSSAPLSPGFPQLLRRISHGCRIAHFHMPNPTGELSALIALPRRIKVVAHYHADIVRQKVLGAFYKPFMNRFLKRADRIIVATDRLLETSKILKPFRSKCTVMPYGIDTDAIHSASDELVGEFRRRFGDFVLFCGRFRYYKGLQYLIRAVGITKTPLVLVGGGYEEEKLVPLMEEVAQRGADVHCLGSVPDDELYALYRASKMVVLPSIFRSEAFGLALVEAMAAGTPVISTELNTGTSVVNAHGVTGFVVPPRDEAGSGQGHSATHVG